MQDPGRYAVVSSQLGLVFARAAYGPPTLAELDVSVSDLAHSEAFAEAEAVARQALQLQEAAAGRRSWSRVSRVPSDAMP